LGRDSITQGSRLTSGGAEGEKFIPLGGESGNVGGTPEWEEVKRKKLLAITFSTINYGKASGSWPKASNFPWTYHYQIEPLERGQKGWGKTLPE